MSSADTQIYVLCALVSKIIQSPPGSGILPPRRQAVKRSHNPNPKLSPAAFASLFLGASFALMLCGSVTFVIGIMLMPWILGFVMVFYFVGILSRLSGFGRAMPWPRSSLGSRTSCKDMPGHLFSKVI